MLIKFVVLSILALKDSFANKFDGFIVSGTAAEIKNYPHAVYITAETKNSAFICGSSVINQKILLTAAHCLAEFIDNGLQVLAFAGGGDIREAKSIRSIKLMLVHERYNQNVMSNDIGLARLTKDVAYNDFIKRTVIPTQIPKTEKFGTITGWGVINDTTGETQPKMLYLRQRIIAESICSIVVRNLKHVFCAGTLDSDDPRPSIGDSGNAFLVKEYLQIGVLSFRPYHRRAVSVYTDVIYYYNWIKEHTLILYCL